VHRHRPAGAGSGYRLGRPHTPPKRALAFLATLQNSERRASFFRLVTASGARLTFPARGKASLGRGSTRVEGRAVPDSRRAHFRPQTPRTDYRTEIASTTGRPPARTRPAWGPLTRPKAGSPRRGCRPGSLNAALLPASVWAPTPTINRARRSRRERMLRACPLPPIAPGLPRNSFASTCPSPERTLRTARPSAIEGGWSMPVPRSPRPVARAGFGGVLRPRRHDRDQSTRTKQESSAPWRLPELGSRWFSTPQELTNHALHLGRA